MDQLPPNYVPLSPPPSHPSHSSRQGIVAVLLAGLAAIGKWGFVLLKFGKFGGTLISMGISLLFFAQRFGWAFGAGVVALIFIHETGHVLAARYEGLPVSMPIFLGPFGAFVNMKRMPEDARQEAVIAIVGPITGLAAALICFVAATTMTITFDNLNIYLLLLGLAYFGCLITLFNMIPVSPLDGGRVAGALSKWVNVLGLAILVVLVCGFFGVGANPNPILFLIILLGSYNVYHRYRQAQRGEEPPLIPARTRAKIGVAYVLVVAVAAIGMTLAHNALVDGSYVPGADSVSIQ